MSRPHAFFTVTDLTSPSVFSAAIDGDTLSIEKDDHRVSLPLLIAADIAAETIRLLLDEDELANEIGFSLFEWLGDDDTREMRRILERITGPEGPTFTSPHQSG